MRTRHSLLLASVGFAAAVTLTACGGGDSTTADAPTPSATASAAPSTATPSTAAHNEADVTFAQMMIPHHQQAVAMAELAPDRAANPAVRDLAAQIQQAQAPEIETMTGWLGAWGEPTAAPTPATGGHTMPGMAGTAGGDMTGMPGMMSQEDMTALEAASGPEFDRMFLEMMVSHHEGAIEMARTEQSDGQFPDAVALAKTIETTQVAEVATMKGLLGTA